MIKLLKNMRRKEVLMVLLCTVLVAVQVYFDLRLPDYMTDLTTLIKTSGATADILSVGVKMLGCTLASAVLAVGCGYLAAKAASGFSFAVREKLFRHVMDIGSEEMQDFSVASLITRTTNDITQIQMIVAMGMQMMIKSQIGSMDEVILCTKDGKDLMIGFNPKFLIDALRVIDDEEVDLYFMNAKAPCFIKDEEQSYIYLILPVNFNAAV